MLILNGLDFRDWDKYTLDNNDITEIELIQNAAKAWVKEFCALGLNTNEVLILCGKGNNGADGYVIATELFHRGFTINLIDCKPGTPASQGNYNAEARLPNSIEVLELESPDQLREYEGNMPIIDAILGTGFIKGLLRGNLSEIISTVNDMENKVYTVDVPSGMDTNLIVTDIAIKAEYCFTFAAFKPCFLLQENAQFVKYLKVINIGLDYNFMSKLTVSIIGYNLYHAAKHYKPRVRFSHKGDYGKILLSAGSKGMMGAATLAAKAAFKSGVGSVTMHLPMWGMSIAQMTVPEAISEVDDNYYSLSQVPENLDYDVMAVGPGIGTGQKTKEFIREVVKIKDIPVVLDADALNILAENGNWKLLMKEHHVLLPHPGEFDRLCGESKTHAERIFKACDLAREIPSVICLKGHHTLIVQGHKAACFNFSGNSGMATAGSGDVLCGIVASLIAQGYQLYEACRLAVYVHGLSGDVYVKKNSEEALMSSDLIENLGSAFHIINKNKDK